MRRRDTAVIPPLRSAIAAIDNAEAVTVEAGTEVESPIAGSRGVLGTSEAARAELSEPQQIAIVKHEISELASHVERLTRLCRHVGVSTGSFYHHFANWDHFVAALLAQWEGDQERQMNAAAAADSQLRRIEIARDLASMYQHATEAAIRAWSLSDEQVRRVQERVDDVRRRHLVSLLRHSGVAAERAELLASVGLAILVGLQQLQGGADKIPDAMRLYQSLVLAAIPPAG